MIIGAALQQGDQATIGRTAALRAGLPVSVPGMSVDRQCASGLMSIAMAAKQIIVDGMDIVRRRRRRVHLAGANRSVARSTPTRSSSAMAPASTCRCSKPPRSWPSATASAASGCDAYALQLAAAHRRGAGGRRVRRRNRAGQRQDGGQSTRPPARSRSRDVTLDRDEGNRPDTTLEGLAALRAGHGAGRHHHRRQREPAFRRRIGLRRHGAAASPQKRGLAPLGRYLGIAVAGTEPDEMGIGPVFAVPKLLRQHGLAMDDIGLWELNEAFAVQVALLRATRSAFPTTGST